MCIFKSILCDANTTSLSKLRFSILLKISKNKKMLQIKNSKDKSNSSKVGIL